MKRLFAFLAFSALAWAQPQAFSVWFTNPSGIACNAGQGVLYATTGTLWTCQSGVFAQVTGGGGTFTALSGDATSTATGGATTVTGANGAAIPVSANVVGTNSSGQIVANTNINGVTQVTANPGTCTPGTTQDIWNTTTTTRYYCSATNVWTAGASVPNTLSVGNTLLDPVNGLAVHNVRFNAAIGTIAARAKAACIFKTNNCTLTIAFLGDSNIGHGWITSAFYTSLKQRLGDAGIGFVSFYSNALLTTAGTWVGTTLQSNSVAVNLAETTSSDIATPASKQFTITTTYGISDARVYSSSWRRRLSVSSELPQGHSPALSIHG